ncbi:MAG: flagellar basal body L-ring protein FlgH [Planctomycetota bacterium]|nr:flagellar basal body L-ring protein FlgH [Planctomycetota bacterium]
MKLIVTLGILSAMGMLFVADQAVPQNRMSNGQNVLQYQPMMRRNIGTAPAARDGWKPQARVVPRQPNWKRNFFDENRQSRHIQDRSWTFIDVPDPREVKEQDIITILVDEKSEVTVDSQFNRQRNNTFTVDLKEFVRLNDRGNLVGAAANQPAIDSAIQERAQTKGQSQERESIKYRIAATVANVYPNGNLVLIARKRIQTDDEMWVYELSGILSSKDVLPNRTATSENIADLLIRKRQMGKVYSTSKWRWGMKLIDALSPF